MQIEATIYLSVIRNTGTKETKKGERLKKSNVNKEKRNRADEMGNYRIIFHFVVMATPFFTQTLLLTRESMKRATSPLATLLLLG